VARFTPGQLRDVLGITKETFRYWKKEFPSLVPATGARACFGPADLLLASIVKQLTELGLPVRRIAPLVERIHRECKNVGWFVLERQILTVYLDSSEVRFVGDVRAPVEPILCVPLAPLVASLRARLLQEDHLIEQRTLALSPRRVAGGALS